MHIRVSRYASSPIYRSSTATHPGLHRPPLAFAQCPSRHGEWQPAGVASELRLAPLCTCPQSLIKHRASCRGSRHHTERRYIAAGTCQGPESRPSFILILNSSPPCSHRRSPPTRRAHCSTGVLISIGPSLGSTNRLCPPRAVRGLRFIF